MPETNLLILLTELLSFKHAVSSNPRWVGIRSPISTNAPDLIFLQGKLELVGALYQLRYAQVGSVVWGEYKWECPQDSPVKGSCSEDLGEGQKLAPIKVRKKREVPRLRNGNRKLHCV